MGVVSEGAVCFRLGCCGSGLSCRLAEMADARDGCCSSGLMANGSKEEGADGEDANEDDVDPGCNGEERAGDSVRSLEVLD